MSSEVRIEGHCDPRFGAVRELFEAGFASGDELGAAVCFVLDGETVVDLWGGHRDLERAQAWESDTLVNVYSATKGMTAICAHQLIERGLLDLDAPVASYWPEFAAAGKETLPVRTLLDHTSGLPALREQLPEAALYDWERMTTALANEEPRWNPGERLGYQALTFGFLVGELIRRVGGQSVGRYFRENVAEPLGADFYIGLPAECEARTSAIHGKIVPERSRSGLRADGPMANFLRDLTDPKTLTGSAFGNPHQPAGCVNSRDWRAAEIPSANGHGTAESMARVYGALARGGELDGVRILEAHTIEAAAAQQRFEADMVLGGLPMRVGLGFLLRHDLMPLSPSPRAFGHPGAGGFLGMADPDAKVGFGFTRNRVRPQLFGAEGAFAMLRAFFGVL